MLHWPREPSPRCSIATTSARPRVLCTAEARRLLPSVATRNDWSRLAVEDGLPRWCPSACPRCCLVTPAHSSRSIPFASLCAPAPIWLPRCLLPDRSLAAVGWPGPFGLSRTQLVPPSPTPRHVLLVVASAHTLARVPKPLPPLCELGALRPRFPPPRRAAAVDSNTTPTRLGPIDWHQNHTRTHWRARGGGALGNTSWKAEARGWEGGSDCH